jgi:hypothetical protein
MSKKPYLYKPRQERNEKSRNEAKAHMERWDETEVATLLELWTTDEADLIALASLLGRTVEACRQKFYDVQKRPETVVEDKLQRVDKWTKGFTSLEDMGY